MRTGIRWCMFENVNNLFHIVDCPADACLVDMNWTNHIYCWWFKYISIALYGECIHFQANINNNYIKAAWIDGVSGC